MAIDAELQGGEARRLIEHGDAQLVEAARRGVKREVYREGMQAPAGDSVGGAGLKAGPVGVAAYADRVNHVGAGAGVADVLAAKFLRRIIEAANLPKNVWLRRCRRGHASE